MGSCALGGRDEKRWSTSVAPKMYTRVPGETCLRETGRAPMKTGWAETDTGQPGQPNERARWVAKEYKTHARPELYASTPPLEALKVVLSETATGERGAEWRTSTLPARRRVFSLYCTPDAAQTSLEELVSTCQRAQIDEMQRVCNGARATTCTKLRGGRSAVYTQRSSRLISTKGTTSRERTLLNGAWRSRHRQPSGERSAVEFTSSRWISRKHHEIKTDQSDVRERSQRPRIGKSGIILRLHVLSSEWMIAAGRNDENKGESRCGRLADPDQARAGPTADGR